MFVMIKVRVKIFGGTLRLVLDKFGSSATRFSCKVLFILIKYATLILFLAFYVDFGNSSLRRDLK